MGFFSRLLGRSQTIKRKTTGNNPLHISKPVIGFLNLNGDIGASLAETDKAYLEPLFHASQLSNNAVPKCQVLFIAKLTLLAE
jgi:hypothetical protein